ncbi:Calcium-dependent protein kinase 2 (PfCDPK2) [Durusdinium trenchii]|uniref:Calcium-dependent protein kinase 2 (PfCDPK2) n=1 Tax=Durusdinium trenchii TaxID=1381693 RepID=A0ABP0M9F8_9DINO
MGEISDLNTLYSTGQKGKVHYTEWLAATMKPSTLATDKAIKQVFHYLDIDQTGKIKPHELYRVLGCNNAVTTVIQAADADGDSVIDEEEFRALMRNMAKRLDKAEVHPRRLGFQLNLAPA